MKTKRIWPSLFLTALLPASWCAAQDPLPQRADPSPAGTSATPTPIPESVLKLIPPPAAPTPSPPTNLPDLSQLDQIFKQSAPGKEAIEYRAHVEWRQLKNRTVADPAVVAAKASAEAATTDLEKRNRLRHYYEIFYARMGALASTPEMVAYLDAAKKTHLDLLAQPRVRPTPGSSATSGSSPTPQPNTTPSPAPAISPLPNTIQDVPLPNE